MGLRRSRPLSRARIRSHSGWFAAEGGFAGSNFVLICGGERWSRRSGRSAHSEPVQRPTRARRIGNGMTVHEYIRKITHVDVQRSTAHRRGTIDVTRRRKGDGNRFGDQLVVEHVNCEKETPLPCSSPDSADNRQFCVPGISGFAAAFPASERPATTGVPAAVAEDWDLAVRRGSVATIMPTGTMGTRISTRGPKSRKAI